MPEAGLMGFHNPQQINGIIGSGAKLADLYLPVKINGDMELLKAIGLLLIDFEKNLQARYLTKNLLQIKLLGTMPLSNSLTITNWKILQLPLGYHKLQFMRLPKCWHSKSGLFFVGEWGLLSNLTE
ncbi:hypothetical protein [Pedobacter panaciterrae]